jgi:hypothetical protein
MGSFFGWFSLKKLVNKNKLKKIIIIILIFYLTKIGGLMP